MARFEDRPFVERKEVLYKAIKAAKLGRKVLNQYFGRLEHVEEKYQAGLVSEADKESEMAIFDYLRRNFPHDDFVGEESAQDLSGYLPINEPGRGRWIVDPLDGTTNYIHRFPIFCVSIGYEIDGIIQVGVIDVPQLGEVYTTMKGFGSYVNGRPLRVSETKTLHESFLATGFFGENPVILDEQLKMFSDLVKRCRAVRRPGSAAYDLCMVARGVYDAYWERNLKPWDSAAGMLLVQEAGGEVTTFRGHEFHPFKNSILAGNPHMMAHIQKFLAPHIRPETE